MKIAVKYCGICESKKINNRCRCGGRDFFARRKDQTLRRAPKIIRRSVIIIALAFIGRLMFDALTGGR